MRTHPVGALAIAAAALFAGCGRGDCKAQQPLARVCLPELAVPERELSLAAADTCTSACNFVGMHCDAAIDTDKRAIALTVLTTQCQQADGCVAVCVRHDVSCTVPPLQAGSWAVVANGLAAGTLQVGTGGTDGCTLPPGNLP